MKNQISNQGKLKLSVGGEDNKIYVQEVSFSGIQLNCDAENNILEIKTEKVLSCSGIVNVDGVIEHPLNIYLLYAVEITKKPGLTIEEE